MNTERKYQVEIKESRAMLFGEFGQNLACKKFNLTIEELAKAVGVKTRGKHKGSLRGEIRWLKTTRGGWVKTGQYDHEAMRGHGFIAPNNKCFYFQIVANGEVLYGAKNDPYEGRGIANWKEVLLSEVCGKEIVKEEEEKESTEKLSELEIKKIAIRIKKEYGYKFTDDMIDSMENAVNTVPNTTHAERLKDANEWMTIWCKSQKDKEND